MNDALNDGAMQKKVGASLVIIGGGEDRKNAKDILQKFVDLVGGDRRIVVLTAASTVGEEMWQMYEGAFADLGVRGHRPLHINARTEAELTDNISLVDGADGIFMAGGDQKRLMAMIGGTGVHAAMLRAYDERAVCIAGTSAGASAMSSHMIAAGQADLEPQKDAVCLGAGLGLLGGVLIDQHFSERQRLPRLLGVIAQNAFLFGVGIDEDTALIVQAGVGLEIVGQGAVTVIDGRRAYADIVDIKPDQCPTLIDLCLHLLPSGTRYRESEETGAVFFERDGRSANVPSETLRTFLAVTALRKARHENP